MNEQEHGPVAQTPLFASRLPPRANCRKSIIADPPEGVARPPTTLACPIVRSYSRRVHRGRRSLEARQRRMSLHRALTDEIEDHFTDFNSDFNDFNLNLKDQFENFTGSSSETPAWTPHGLLLFPTGHPSDPRGENIFANAGRIVQTPIPGSNMESAGSLHFPEFRGISDGSPVSPGGVRRGVRGDNVFANVACMGQTPIPGSNLESSGSLHFPEFRGKSDGSLGFPGGACCGVRGDHVSADAACMGQTPIPGSKLDSSRPQHFPEFRSVLPHVHSSHCFTGIPSGVFQLDRAEVGLLGRAPPAPTSGKPLVADFTTESFTFLFHNIQGLVSHEAELSALLEQANYPTFLGLNETFLPGEGIVKHFDVKGYVKVSRLDRRDGSGFGGILLYAKRGYEDFIVHVGDSRNAERSWHILHTDRGPISVALWYRPPNRGEIDSILTLTPEIDEFARDVSGQIILGDLNVHEASWLKHSDGTSVEGRELHEFCRERGLDEKVRTPTRGANLLDLVLTDLGPLVRAKVIPGVSDHEAVLCTFEFPLPEVKPQQREVFDYSKARWGEMCDHLSCFDWSTLIRSDDADGSVERFTSFLLSTAKMYIP